MAEDKTLKEQRDESLEKVEEDEDGNLSWMKRGSDLGEEIPEESSLSWMKRGSDLAEEIPEESSLSWMKRGSDLAEDLPPSDKPKLDSDEERAATAGHAIGKVVGIDTLPEVKAALGRLVELGATYGPMELGEETLTKAKDLLTAAGKAFGTQVFKDKEFLSALAEEVKGVAEGDVGTAVKKATGLGWGQGLPSGPDWPIKVLYQLLQPDLAILHQANQERILKDPTIAKRPETREYEEREIKKLPEEKEE